MSGFSAAQLRKLCGKLDRRHVHSRRAEDREIDYIEGWFAISEANAIFGFGAWDRETVLLERVFERSKGETTSCSYLARVRVRVRAGSTIVVREGTGSGSASSRHPAEAHERAVKGAETDATKRALATFGNRFGLGLYDREQAGVTPREARPLFVLRDLRGEVIAANLSGEGFCSGVRQIIEAGREGQELEAWFAQNRGEIVRLKTALPSLRNSRGEHFGDLLERLLAARVSRLAKAPRSTLSADASAGAAVATMSQEQPGQAPQCGAAEGPSSLADPSHMPLRVDATASGEPLAPVERTADAFVSDAAPKSTASLAPSRLAMGPRIDKAALPIAISRRLRDKDHLRRVGTLPCLVCNDTPSHPHHLTFAQPRGLALKVSDEFVVPLCAQHHNDLHLAASELLWWKRLGIEPLPIARRLWETRGSLDSQLLPNATN